MSGEGQGPNSGQGGERRGRFGLLEDNASQHSEEYGSPRGGPAGDDGGLADAIRGIGGLGGPQFEHTGTTPPPIDLIAMQRQLNQMQANLAQSQRDNLVLIQELRRLQNRSPAPVHVKVTAEDLFGKPAKFKGERGPDAERFLTDIELYISEHATQLPTINKRVKLALTFMEDKAAKFRSTYLTRIQNGEVPFADWDEFVETFKLSFERIEDAAAALEELKRMRQGPLSAAEYHDQFHRAASRTKLSDEDKRVRFYEGLNRAVKDALIYSLADTHAYTDLCKEAIRLDNRIAQRKWEEAGQRPGGNTKPFNATNHFNRYRNPIPTPVAPKDPNAMDIDAGKFTETRTCYNCGKPGHLHRFCREPPQTKRGQYVKATNISESTTNDPQSSASAPTNNDNSEIKTIASSLASVMDRLTKMEVDIQQRLENQKGF